MLVGTEQSDKRAILVIDFPDVEVGGQAVELFGVFEVDTGHDRRVSASGQRLGTEWTLGQGSIRQPSTS